MSFLNPLLAIGAVALSIPLIIHLLNRSRFRTVDWAAMHLLESVISSNRRRFRLDQLILLLIRCAIPALLALLMARPVLTGSGIPAGDTPASLVILLDNSYSMDVADPAGTRFDAAVETACSLIDSAPAGSEFAVLLTGGVPTPLFDQPVSDARAVNRRLRQLTAGMGASSVAESLDAALSLVQRMSHGRRELIVLSDFQPADWQQFQESAGDSFSKRLQDQAIPVELVLLPVVSSTEANSSLARTPNLALEQLVLPPHALAVGQQVSVRAMLRNYGAEELPSVRVLLKLNGEEIAVVQTAVQPDGVTQVLFPCAVATPGSHVLSAELIYPDALESDNHCSAAVQVRDSLPVLLVDGDPSAEPLQSETDFLSIALTPFTYGRLQLSDLITTRTIPTAGLNDEMLQNVRVVVLANVARLSDAQLESLRNYVDGGGTLLVTAGNRLDLNWYTQQLYADGSGLLPAGFVAVQGEDSSGADAAAQPQGKAARIVSQRFEHPSLLLFNDPAGGDLSAAEIRRWYSVTAAERNSSEATGATEDADNAAVNGSETREQTAAAESAAVLVRLDNGAPLLLEKRYGDGLVLQFTTACDAEWSDLPQRPVFVPLMQQVIIGMATGVEPPRNITAGEPAVAVVTVDAVAATAGDSAAVDATEETGPPAAMLTTTVVTPDGTREAVPVVQEGSQQLARYLQTLRPGLYTMTLPDGEDAHFVSGTDPAESALRLMDQQSCELLADRLQATLLRSGEEWRERDQLRRFGREIWKYLLAGLLVLLLLEMILQQRFAGVRA